MKQISIISKIYYYLTHFEITKWKFKGGHYNKMYVQNEFKFMTYRIS